MKENIIQKYKTASDTLKATIWYMICNILQKLAAFLIIPILTRMLTTSDYGLYSVFLAWVEIVEILATMRIYSNGFVAGLVKNSEEQEKYTCSIQFVSIITISVCFALFYCFSDQLSYLMQFDKKYIFYMFFSFFATSSIGIWSSRQRVNNKYQLMVIVTLLYSVLAPLASVIAAYFSPNRLDTVIEVRIIAQFVTALPFFLMNLLGENKAIVWRYCKESISYNLPLIPYYLSMVVLNSSDRIMIKNIIGESEAGIYSVAYSLSMAVFVIVGALNLSLQPWIFNKLKNNSAEDANKVISTATCLIAVLNICVLMLSPELIRLIASERYAEAIWTMPPIIISLLLMFIYQQFLNFHFYFGETRILFIASIAAAGLNLLLNYCFIGKFGYMAAGYTTFISYLLLLTLYYVTMKRIANKHHVEYRDYFNSPFIFTVVIILSCSAIVIALLYPYPLVRYSLFCLIFLIAVMLRKRIISFLIKAGLISG